jgi:transcriptional regulator of aromatic amino acid metabolism
VIWSLLEALRPDLREPVVNWCPGRRLVLPPTGTSGTMVLQDVGGLTPEDQLRLFDWLERNVGKTQVISTSSTPLLPRVQAGTFMDMLYYRLNVVCADVLA